MMARSAWITSSSSLLLALLACTLLLGTLPTTSPPAFLRASATATLDRSDMASHGVKAAISRYYYSQVLNVVPLIYLGNDWDTYENGCFVLLDTNPQPFVYTVAVPSEIAYDHVWSIIKMEGYNDSAVNINEMRLWQFEFDFTIAPGTSQPSCDLTSADTYWIAAPTHEEFMMLAVEPYDEYVLTLGTAYIGVLQTSPANFTTYNATAAWNGTFTPRCAAVHYQHWGVVVGLTNIGRTQRMQHTLKLFRYSTSGFNVVYTLDIPLSRITNTTSIVMQNTNDYDSKYECSLAIRNSDGRVLLGIQLFNSVLDIGVNSVTAPTSVTIRSTRYNGKKIGFGRTVSWDNNNHGVILYNTLSQDYATYTASSQLQAFDLSGTKTLNDLSVYTYVMPNFQQKIPAFMVSSLVYGAVNTGTGDPSSNPPSAILIMDTLGSVTSMPPSRAGYYTSTTLNADLTLYEPCPPGTFKPTAGYETCTLCPTGTYNKLFNLTSSCTPCPDGTKCPLGAYIPLVAGDDASDVQVIQYPTSDNKGFDDILMDNVFSIHNGKRCVENSPLFWGLVTAACAIGIAFIYVLLRHRMTNRTVRRKFSLWFKFWCRRADFVREGETWIGGLMSFCALIMAGLSIRFMYHFLAEYPIERAPGYDFACEDLLNAAFSSNLLSTSIVPPTQVVPTFEDLDAQDFRIKVDFLSSATTCDDVRAYIVRSSVTVLQVFNCSEVRDGLMRVSMPLPTHSSTSLFTLAGVQIVGGLRVYLSGPDNRTHSDANYERKALDFSETFLRVNQTVQRTVKLDMTITRVVNETSPFDPNGETEFAYIWAPTIFLDPDEVFIVEQDFRLNTNEDFSLTVTLAESAFWVYNKQDPVTRSAGVAFKMLLFILTIIELFALTFLFVKLLGPLFRFCYRCAKRMDMEELLDSDSSDDETTLVDVYGNEFKVRKRNEDEEGEDEHHGGETAGHGGHDGEAKHERQGSRMGPGHGHGGNSFGGGGGGGNGATFAAPHDVPLEHQVPVSARGYGSRNGAKIVAVPHAFSSPPKSNNAPSHVLQRGNGANGDNTVPGSANGDLMLTDFSANGLGNGTAPPGTIALERTLSNDTNAF